MEKVLNKSLLVVVICVLCCLPIFMFGGCNQKTDDKDMAGYNIEITNVSKINGYSPYENKIWYNQKQQRVRFYLKNEYSNGSYTLALIEVPYNDSKIEYMVIWYDSNGTAMY